MWTDPALRPRADPPTSLPFHPRFPSPGYAPATRRRHLRLTEPARPGRAAPGGSRSPGRRCRGQPAPYRRRSPELTTPPSTLGILLSQGGGAMKVHGSDAIRNVALVGHGGSV